VLLGEFLAHGLVPGENLRGVGLAIVGQALRQFLVGQGNDLRREIGGVLGAGLADGDAGDRNAPGICTVDNSASWPCKGPAAMGTPMTGLFVSAATVPARCAAMPAAAMNTAQPRASASLTKACVASGVRCADSTRTSRARWSLSSVSIVVCMVSRSESEPIRMATNGLVMVLSRINSQDLQDLDIF
jgi:hypothetical protein